MDPKQVNELGYKFFVDLSNLRVFDYIQTQVMCMGEKATYLQRAP